MRQAILAASCFLLTASCLDAQSDANTSLPVTRVSLYKNGVGFFEHTASVSGNAQVNIDFTSSQLNDVLQSLTAIDLAGGRISRAGYNSTAPLDQQLKTLPIALGANPTAADFYATIRGARMELHNGTSTITGRLLSIQVSPAGDSPDTPNAPAAAHPYLTIVSDSGDVRTVELTQNTTVHLTDPALDADLNRYLRLLDDTRSQALRHLTLEDRGPLDSKAPRELRVSYISEVPVWKSTYRILFTDNKSQKQQATIQGWSVVDNTTGADWVNVKLSLIAGSPQSFVQPLSQPIYTRRPEIPVAVEAQLEPQTFESGEATGLSGITGSVTDPTGAVVPGAKIVATNMGNGQQQTRIADRMGQFTMSLTQGRYKLEVSMPGFQTYVMTNINVGSQMARLEPRLNVGASSETVTVEASSLSVATESATLAGYSGGGLPQHFKARSVTSLMALQPGVQAEKKVNYEEAVTNSLALNTTSAAFDDFFSYNISDPVTIRKNESALVPILQGKVEADRVTLVHSDGDHISQPLRALWITNATGLTLDRGSFTILEDGNFGGEGLLDPIHPNEKRLLSYAADQAVHVSTENSATNEKTVRITAAKGVITFHSAEHDEVTYVIRNAATDARTIVLEHPVEDGYTLDADIKPEESTPTVHRFRLSAEPNQTVRLKIAANHDDSTEYDLTDDPDDDTFAVFVDQAKIDAKFAKEIAPLLEAKRKATTAQDAVKQTEAKYENLQQTEQRERANITALQTADKEARARFVRDLNKTEDEIASTQKELEARQTASDNADDALTTLIANLTFDEKP